MGFVEDRFIFMSSSAMQVTLIYFPTTFCNSNSVSGFSGSMAALVSAALCSVVFQGRFPGVIFASPGSASARDSNSAIDVQTVSSSSSFSHFLPP